MAVKLSLRGITKVFDSENGPLEVVNNVSLHLKNEEFVVLLGPSGCGKSTLLRIIAGLERPTEGAVVLDGQPVEGPGRERGMVFQSYTSFPWLSVRENVEFSLLPVKMSKAERRQVARYYVDLVGLSEFENFLPRNLSGGMQQRLAIARTLAAQPTVLLFDEPFGALDAQTRSLMQEELQKLLREAGERIALFVTHDVEEAVYLADRIILFTKRPASIREEIQITGREIDGVRVEPASLRRHTFKLSPAFIEMRRQIDSLVRQEMYEARVA